MPVKAPYLLLLSAAALLSAGVFGPGGAESGMVRPEAPDGATGSRVSSFDEPDRRNRLPAERREDTVASGRGDRLAPLHVRLAAQPPLLPARSAPSRPFTLESDGLGTSVDGVAFTEEREAPPLRVGRLQPVGGPFLLAQSGNPAPAPPEPAIAQAPPKAAVDETALRYFARQGDQRRLQQEIARLRSLYPDWTPPADPLAIPAASDAKLDAMWQLYSEGRFADVRKAIVDRAAAEPAWQAPQDLLQRLDVAEARERLANASELKQYNAVVRIAADTPSLLTCSDVDVMWRVAEALALTDRPERARDAYAYILKNCDDPAERLATIEKAIPLLPRDLVEPLLDSERPGSDGKGEFETARADIIRRAVSEAQNDPGRQADPADLETMRAIAARGGSAADALMLGWYFLRRDDPAAASEWFDKARQADETAEASQGLALALIGLGRPVEAEAALYRWRDASEEIRKVYLAAAANLLATDPPAVVDAAVLQRIAVAAAANRDVAVAQQLGWYARAFNQHETAGKWFSTALQWNAEDEPSAYGLALTRQLLRDTPGTAEIQRLWAGRSERIAELGETRNRNAAAVAPTEGGRTEAAPRPERAPQGGSGDGSGGGVKARVERLPERHNCRRTGSNSALRGEAALARGWCLMDINRPIEAVAAFEAAMAGSGEEVRREAAWGQSLAYLSRGLTDDAAVSAARSSQDAARRQELEVQILTQRATGFFEAGRYVETLLALDQRAALVPERLDLMSLRGYAYLELGRVGDAERVFRALAAAGSKDGVRGLGAVASKVGNQ